MQNFDIYEMVTNLIIQRLEAGVVPWHMPWKTAGAMPRNLVSKKTYRGFNFWYLLSYGFERPFFLTFNQVQELGATIRKGSKSFQVVFWKMLDNTRGNVMEVKRIPYLRYYRVFHVDDVEGIDPKKLPSYDQHDQDFDPIGTCDRLVEEWKDCPKIQQNAEYACYVPSIDTVKIPNPRRFFKAEQYYSTLYHELVYPYLFIILTFSLKFLYTDILSMESLDNNSMHSLYY